MSARFVLRWATMSVALASGGCGASSATSTPDAGSDGPTTRQGAFVHPGVLVDAAGLDFVKTKYNAGSDPWNSAFAAILESKYASPTYTPSPLANVMCGANSMPNVGCSAEMSDAIAAYTQALLWVLTGTASYAQKAIEIMNAWSAILKQHTDYNAPLQAAWAGSVFPRAAEIIRWTNAGWAAADIAQFEAMLKAAYLPEFTNGAPRENGNWELSMIEAMMDIAVFLDDTSTFQTAVSMWQKRVPAYVYLTSDGPTPDAPPGGDYTSAPSILGFWFKPGPLVDGLCQETCRDLGHVQYGLAAMIHAAETARIQGVDLYSMEAKRIAAGLEFHAQLLDGAAAPSGLCGGALSMVTPLPTWEIAYNEYAGRLGMSLPSTSALVTRIRPTGVDHHMDWETLTHAELGNVGIP
jgi:hypothetical protein